MTEAPVLEHGASVADRPYLKAFLLDEASREAVEKVSAELMIPHAAVRRGGIREAIAQLGESRSPRLLVVDISDRDLPLSEVNELAEVCEPGVRVITVGDRNDVGLFRDLMSSGVTDYLVKPLTAQLLHRSLLNAVEGASPARQTSRLGRLVSVIGSRGGVGATTIATSCGWAIANRRHRRVALLDLDLHFGTAALSLDLDSSRGLREALEQSSRIDNLYLERSMVRHGDAFHLLGGEEGIEEGLELDPPALETLTNELRGKYHFVIMDVPRHAGSLMRGALEASSNVVLVTDLSVAGMRDTLRLIQFLSATNAGCGVLIVANRLGEHKDRALTIGDFEKGIGRSVDVRIAFQRRQLAQAADAGEPAASRCRAMARAVDSVVTELCGGSAAPRRFLPRLFS